MQALVARSYGPLEELAVADLPAPVPGPGQVLVRAEAAALNPADLKLVTGGMRPAGLTHPFVPGIDVTGTVTAVGEGVTRYAPGDHVLAWNGVRSGALAELVLVEDDPFSTHRPAGLPARQAAALPAAALTAAALVEAAGLSPGLRVLVVGAAGGIGSFVVQLAKHAGAQVIATGRAGDEGYLHTLGADDVLDYARDDIAAQVAKLTDAGADVVIDLARAGDALAQSAAATRTGGLIVSPLGGPATFPRDVRAIYTGTAAAPHRLGGLAAQAAEGRLRVPVAAAYPFSEARQALIDFAGHHYQGKVTITF
ncbi:NADP-dependent oxidoreductase [[Actinomadura] parvosata]|uniref:NADP-dependent oxidoreductase n=1 Tax=[Actinomadura] parvosata TaxID=1955412 RepID=UPI00406C18F6